MKLSKVWILVALLIPVHAYSFQPVYHIWNIAEHQPDFLEGGRANTVAIHPTNQNELFVASDSGGLFKSIDRGLSWKHIDGLPVIFLQSVAYVDSNIILVSAAPDFKTPNSGGGVWRSADGGDTWTQAELMVGATRPTLTAFEISTSENNAVVGTSIGLFVSTDGGLSWKYQDPFGHQTAVFAVLVTPGVTPGDPSRIYAGGPAGVRLGTIPLGSWVPPVNNNLGGIHPIHAFGRSPLISSQAFLANGHLLFYTDDTGITWKEIPTKNQPSCGGGPFIKAALRPGLLDLYYGDGCGLRRMTAPVTGTVANFSNPAVDWHLLLVDHRGTRDLAVFQTDAVLLATNGGLHDSANGGLNWTFTGGSRAGYAALQISEVKGQYIDDLDAVDLYFATRDNKLLASDSDADIAGSVAVEAFGIDVASRVTLASEARVTGKMCDPCATRLFDRQFSNELNWFDTVGGSGAPVFIRGERYVQNVPAQGLDFTDNEGGDWDPYAPFNEQPVGLPKVARVFAAHSVLYQSFLDAAAIKLLRIQELFLNVTVHRPDMDGFGSLGTRRLRDVYPIYGVSPNFRHLIAPDISDNTMKKSTNSGSDWFAVPDDLTNKVTDQGRLLFRSELNGFPDAPVVTAVSFSPQDESRVLIGTIEGGIFFSGDGGLTWGKINGTERATYVTSFYWEDANTVYVSTYGRGLWKLTDRSFAGPTAVDELCNTCNLVSMNPTPQRPPFDHSILVFDGHILAVRTDKGRLREVFVTRGASVLFTGDPKDPQEDIVITEGTPKESDPLPKPPEGWMVVGVVFMGDDTLTGAAFAESELSLLPPEK